MSVAEIVHQRTYDPSVAKNPDPWGDIYGWPKDDYRYGKTPGQISHINPGELHCMDVPD